ncbi:hypothetical protein NAEGRDRAFT_80349 [Naegleria gruberi]|uniref:Uncharacterized protein n=1 Tax=Naegleria gruberi TaxID=5762 RepID=D2VKT0_NAEGR|nr:uncharacterized protein NAEGRDRAFT_80349 [Naegleria gruberi]EFC42649.1 hypothetical protein NAEGRDRAFT_80349 [Naegleria gruberi]|eukprot:XP_002675393.1 hypothetical protein NAEGRDRAFT_80349 [Naegleria gruberi strain NEG-M]
MKRKNVDASSTNKKQATLDGFVTSNQQNSQGGTQQDQQNSQDQQSSQLSPSNGQNLTPKYSAKQLDDETDWIASLFNFNKEGFEKVSSNIVYPKITETPTTPKTILRNVTCTEVSLELLISNMIPNHFWQILLDILNTNLTRESTTGKASSHSKYYNDIDISQLFSFLGTVISLENNHSKLNANAKTNLQQLRAEKLDSMIPGYRRYFSLMKCFAPSDQQFELISTALNDITLNAVTIGSNFVVDETVYAYQISSIVKAEAELLQCPIPVVYIPRKPYPNGLMSYKLCVLFPGCRKPYVLAILPQYKVPMDSPQEAMLKLLKMVRECTDQNLHITGDAAFGSFTIFDELIKLNVVGTFSISGTEKSWIWDLLKRTLTHGNWKAAEFISKSVIASMQRNPQYQSDRDKKYHHLVSNAFDFEHCQPFQQTLANILPPFCRKIRWKN